MYKDLFLNDRPWISPSIKSISNELDITCHAFASQLSGHCDAIANQVWRHQQNVKRASETRGWCVKILVLAPFMDSLCRVINKIMYVLLWRTVYVLTRVLFCINRSPRKYIHYSLYHFCLWIHFLSHPDTSLKVLEKSLQVCMKV